MKLESPPPSESLVKAVMVTAELMGRVFSPESARVFVADLAAFPESAVLQALARTRRECRGALTLADVVSRIDDGRPGPDEAWALLPFDEATTVVWTDEMASAWGVASQLYDAGDKVGARFAFREAYTAAVAQSRSDGLPAKWTPSLGHDPHARETAINEAVRKGRLTAEHGARLLPYRDRPAKEVAGLLPRMDR